MAARAAGLGRCHGDLRGPALHSVKANISWLVESKKAAYIAVIKTNQAIVHQLAALAWRDIAVRHTRSETGHGRRESRSVKSCAIADELGGIAFLHARPAIRVHRRRKGQTRTHTLNPGRHR
jgi:hypothetical protein